jgi:hypothetical protein
MKTVIPFFAGKTRSLLGSIIGQQGLHQVQTTAPEGRPQVLNQTISTFYSSVLAQLARQ